MNTSTWIGRSVSKLLPEPKKGSKPSVPSVEESLDATEKGVPAQGAAVLATRSTRERLSATLRRQEEALSPRVLRRTLEELKAIVDPRVSEVEGGRRAQGVALWYARATEAQRRDMWLLMSEQFVADAQKVQQAQAQFAAAVGTPDEAAAEVRYRRATVSPRRRLLQRFSVFDGGIRFLVDLRAEMLPHLMWRWNTCSPPGSTWAFWTCAASAGIHPHP
jgi:malonyl-CoA decarboxylase